MNPLLRFLMPEFRVISPGWKLRRCIRRMFRTVVELLALVGIAVLLLAVWYFAFFVHKW